MKPYARNRLHVEPGSHAERQAEEWATTRPRDAAAMRNLARVPIAVWLGDWTRDPAATVDGVFSRCTPGSLPVFVAYNIPNRDCGSASAGGAETRAAYATWVAQVAAGFNGRTGILVLEPDALALVDCLSPSELVERHAMIADAVGVLGRAGARVYIDAGDSNWIPEAAMAESLRAAGVAAAAGFATNVSHYEYLADEHGYAQGLRAILGTKAHYIVDTGRNGLGHGPNAPYDWCNQPGRGCGRRPTLNPAKPGCDALLWVKNPGESDGPHNGGPAAGVWWPEYALTCHDLAVPPFPAVGA